MSDAAILAALKNTKQSVHAIARTYNVNLSRVLQIAQANDVAIKDRF